MLVKIRPSGRSLAYSKQTDNSIFMGAFRLALNAKLRMKTQSLRSHGILFVTIRIAEDRSISKEYVIPLWFMLYCKGFKIYRFLPIRLSWTIELPD
jgi:hypothetical protein